MGNLSLFRRAFGACALGHVAQYVWRGWIPRYYSDPPFHFAYNGFGWVGSPPGWGVYVPFAGVALGGLGLLLNYRPRTAAGIFTFFFLWLFLVDQAYYQNHYYLMGLVGALLTLPESPTQAWLLRAQFALVYLFGGIHKLSGDWLHGEPMRSILAARWQATEPLVAGFTYGGALFDLLVVPALLYRPTRWFAVAASVAFHVTNATLLRIGAFPWLMLAATVLFLRPLPPVRLPRPALAYLALQLLLPLRPYLASGDANWTGEGDFFSWRMISGYRELDAVFLLIDPATGKSEVIPPYFFLNTQQAAALRYPELAVRFSHFLKDYAEGQGRPGTEVHARLSVAWNGRGFRPLVDPERDLAKVPVGWRFPREVVLPNPERLPENRRLFGAVP